MPKFITWTWRLTLVTLLLAVSVCAQGTSRISGTVSDNNGGLVAGATVVATNDRTGVTYTQTTTSSGTFSFNALSVGLYTITVEQKGFKKAFQAGNILEIDTPLTVNITLEVGRADETVTVQAGGEALQTADATIGNVVEQKAIEQLPLNGRNPLTLLLNEPGVNQRSSGAAGSGVHVNGARDRAYNVTIDGIEANESSVPNPVSNLYRLTPDNVQEYKVTTNNATAEQGRNSGAAISVGTRSGTNNFHGSGFYFIRDDRFNSAEFYANAQKQPKREIKLDQYGFEIGGPIIKKKTFFFGSFQFNDINFTQPIDQSFGIPVAYTAQARVGNFRYLIGSVTLSDGTVVSRNSPLLVNSATGALRPEVPLCGGAVTTGCVASYNILNSGPAGTPYALDTAAQSYLGRIPTPNNFQVAGDGLNTGGYLWNPPTQVRGPAYTARVDHNFNENNSAFARYLFSDYNTLKGDPLNGRPQLFPGDFPPLGEVFRRTSNLAISYRRVISSRVVNELTVGYARFNFLFTQGESDPQFPNTLPVDFNLISEPFNLTPRTQRVITTPQILDNLSFVSGNHNIKVGFNFRFYRHVDLRGQPGGVNLTPIINFSATTRPVSFAGTPTAGQFLTPPGINTANDQVNLSSTINNLLGRAANITQLFIGNLNTNGYSPFLTGDKVTLFAEKHNLNQYNFFAQDEWQMRPNLTLNYGVRAEINPPGYTSGGQTYVPGSPITQTPGPATPVVGAPGAVTFVKADGWYERKNYIAIGPSVGLAWSPNATSELGQAFLGAGRRSVFRVGYRMAFDTISSFQITAAAGRVPGLITSCSSSFPFTAITAGCSPVTTPNATLSGFQRQLAAPTGKPLDGLRATLQLNSNSPTLTVFAPNMKIPTVHQWSLSFQRELPGGFAMQAAYIGRRGTRLFNSYNINQIGSGPILGSFLQLRQNFRNNCNPNGVGTRPSSTGPCVNPIAGSQIPLIAQLVSSGLTQTAADTFVNSANVRGDLDLNAAGTFAERLENTVLGFKLRPNQQFSAITYIDNLGDSNYHALQLTLRRRFASGLGLNMAYTWGKSIDNQSVDPIGAASGGGLSTTNSRTPTDGFNFRDERGRSDFDRTHLFTTAATYELPFGKGRKFLSNPGWADRIVNGWNLNGIFTTFSGEPFSVRSGVRTANAAHESRAALLEDTRASLQPSLSSAVVGPVYFQNANSFAIPEPGQSGAGRNIFVARGYYNLDIGVTKLLPLTEGVKLQFRAEFFNVLNHPNFDNPRDATVGSPSFRSNVFGQACCSTVGPPSTQTIIQTGESGRVIQFALKLQF